MGILTKQAYFKIYCKLFMRSKVKIPRQSTVTGLVDKNDGTSSNRTPCKATANIPTRGKCLEDSRRDETSTEQTPPLSNTSHVCPTLEERADQQSLSSPSEETSKDFYKNTSQSIRYEKPSSTESQLNWTWFDISESRQMKHSHTITTALNQLVELNKNDTRLVNGLLTTTLCSTEL